MMNIVILTRRKQHELFHPRASNQLSNKYSVNSKSIYGEEGSSLNHECFFQEKYEENKEKMIYR